jgi:hypothetical protein
MLPILGIIVAVYMLVLFRTADWKKILNGISWDA